jgi:hypothetical protein
VRVHTGAKAAQTAQAINAKAFTTGNDIVFGPGQYSPGTSGGKRLLAHELTHTIQQGNLSTAAPKRLSTLRRQPEEERPPVIPQGKRLPRFFIQASPRNMIQRATNADGVDTGPTDNSKTFCKKGTFLGSYTVGQNTASAATGESVIKFKGLNTGKEDNKTCSCDCGFLRQYIKGYWIWGKGGTKNYDVTSCGKNLTMNESTWTEEYMSCDPQADKCKQEYTDTPGWTSGLSDGNYIELYYKFKFQLWDHCQGKAKATAFKTLLIKGETAPRTVKWS